jgi:hypothetical protein
MAIDAGYYEQEEWGEERPSDPAVYAARLAGTVDLLPTITGPWLDVGSGDGRFVGELAAQAGVSAHLRCVERSGSALRHNPAPTVQASADALPFPDGFFRLVTAFEVVEHLPVGLYEATLAELARVSGHYVVLTVPNREKTTRANVRCPVCGCEFNPNRHLRSFSPERMGDLVPGFRLERVSEFGHRAYVYPRPVRLALERIGLLHRPGSPACPQCGYQLRPPPAPSEPVASGGPAADASPAKGLAQTGYRLARRFSPRARHPYFLGACFQRT